jgi:hypothetical protein
LVSSALAHEVALLLAPAAVVAPVDAVALLLRHHDSPRRRRAFSPADPARQPGERTWKDCRWPGEYVNQLHPLNWSQEWFRPPDAEIEEWHRAHGLPPWKPDNPGPVIA